jgi:hypothetical protein
MKPLPHCYDVQLSGGSAGYAVLSTPGGVTRFTETVLRPRLTLPAGADRGRALHILERTEKSCHVSASLSTPLRLQLELVAG